MITVDQSQQIRKLLILLNSSINTSSNEQFEIQSKSICLHLDLWLKPIDENSKSGKSLLDSLTKLLDLHFQRNKQLPEFMISIISEIEPILNQFCEKRWHLS